MKKLLNINQIDEFPFIKRKKEKQLTEKISKRKSSVSISKQKKIDKLRNGINKYGRFETMASER